MTEQSASEAQDEWYQESTQDDKAAPSGGDEPSRSTRPSPEGDGQAPNEDEEQRRSKEWEAGWSGP
ncbi:hypothetical protein ACIRP7_21620 [Streptomyces sp. NPDC102270]|uniref:hypothetical protein n=1 Tax=Streptomyces sp. NPDC102270 TaxID=3366150 RepID=UPI0038201D09